MVDCPACGTEVPEGAFCGSCGGDLSAHRRDGPGGARLGAYAVAPNERVLRPWVTSSLFPHLSRRSRPPFRLGVACLVVLVAALALLRWQAPMVAVCAAGFPLLFVSYLREIGVGSNAWLRTLTLSAVASVVLGAGWAYLAGTVFADGYDVALGFETHLGPTVVNAVAISVAQVFLIMVPTLVARGMNKSTGGSLDGFLIGAIGGTAFVAAATVTFLVPQLAAGPVADGRSVDGLIVEAGVSGVTMPLVGAAVGGMFGAALWFRPRANASGRRRVALLAIVGVSIGLFVGFGFLDVAPFPNGVYVAGYLLIAMLAIIALRIALQVALLNEAPRDTVKEGELRCTECDHEFPDSMFCPHCGVASEAARREAATPGRGVGYRGVLGTTSAGLAAASATAVITSLLITPGVAPYRCPPDCGGPPIGIPVETNPRYAAPNGAFSVNYPAEGTAYKTTFNPNGVVLDYVGGDTGTLALFGEPARDRTPKEITLDLIRQKYPDATIEYEIPNASLGYQPGYGVVADDYPQNSGGKYTRLRVLVIVAVKHDYALIAAAVGPYHRFTPDYGSGHPSGANLELAMDIGKYVNSFKWSGDRHVHNP